jgi:Uma2 family endonuclease
LDAAARGRDWRGSGIVAGMPTLIFDPQPGVIEELIEERSRLGLDRRDEVWEGVLHMIPPPSYAHERIASFLHWLLRPHAEAAGLDLVGTVGIGVKDDNRFPDLMLQRRKDAQPQWQQTAALVIEIRSPGDDTDKKLGFYASHGVDELLIIDPDERSVDWLELADGEYRPLERSTLIDLGPAELRARIEWRPV